MFHLFHFATRLQGTILSEVERVLVLGAQVPLALDWSRALLGYTLHGVHGTRAGLNG